MNPLNLVVPGMCGPLPEPAAIQNNSTTSSLARLLARADSFPSMQKGFHQELLALCDMQAMSAPSAVLSLLGERQELGEGYWFHADPVHLQADMDRAILRDSLSLDLKQDEADDLIREINQHFYEDGIRLVSLDKNHWFLNITDHARIETTSLHDMIGCNVNFYLPKGEDEKYWKRFLNEVQMLLHMSDVNHRRELSGLLPVNSLWVWGGGILPKINDTFKQRIFTNVPMAKGLAIVHDASHHPISDVASLFETIDDDLPSLVILDDVFVPACYGDVIAWQSALDDLFDQWINPLVAHAMKRKSAIRLYPCNGINYLISPANKYRFYRKGNITDYIGAYE